MNTDTPAQIELPPDLQEEEEDEVMAEVHRIKREISAEYDHDVVRMMRAADERAVRSGRVLIPVPEPKREE